MTDGNFQQPGDTGGEPCKILKVQVMTRINPEVAFHGCFRGPDERGNGHFPVGRKIPGEGFGVKFHPVGTGIGGMADHLLICFNKNGGPDSMVLEPGHHLLQELPVGYRVPAGVGCQHTGRIGYQRNLVGPNLQYQVNKTGRWVTLDIKFGLYQ